MDNHGDILLNPIRMRIIQHMADKKGRTVGSLSELMSDIPRTTLYRHINMLFEHGYLLISKETRIRGAYEREYMLNLEALQETAEEESIEKNVKFFLMKLLSDFDRYFKDKGDPIKDRLFLSSNTLLMSDNEYSQFIDEIFEVVKKHLNFEPNQERKQRTLSIISSPNWEKGDINHDE